MEEKLRKILELQEQGMERRKIAENMGYARLDSMTKWMRSRGYGLDDNQKLYIFETHKNTQITLSTEVPLHKNKKSQILDVQQHKSDNTQVLSIEKQEDMQALQELLQWWKSRKEHDSVIDVITLDLPESDTKATGIKVNELVWEKWRKFCDRNKHYKAQDLLAQALLDYIKKFQ